MTIFHSYVCLPEGKSCEFRMLIYQRVVVVSGYGGATKDDPRDAEGERHAVGRHQPSNKQPGGIQDGVLEHRKTIGKQ